MRKFVITLLVIVVALAVFLIIKTDKVKFDSENIVVDTGGASGQFARLEENAIFLPDQRPGDEVVVKILNLKDSGFIIIHKDSAGGPGAIVGVSKWFLTGEYTDVTIGTTESLSDGLEYYAMLYKDDGNGIFDPKNDTPVYSTTSSAQPMMMIFQIDKNASNPRDVQINF